MITATSITRRMAFALAAFGLGTTPLAAQVETIDPDSAIDADLVEQPGDQPVYAEPQDAVTYTQEPDATAPADSYPEQPQWSARS